MNLKAVLAMLVLSATTGCAHLSRGPAPVGRFEAREVDVDGVRRGYQVFVPAAKRGKRPVILFLHGSGERGGDNLAQLNAGLGPYLRKHLGDFPAIVVLPQVPERETWTGTHVRVALAALDAATREFRGDPKRTYLTGLSMGGYGTWEIGLSQPQRFAALVPICGALEPPPIAEFAHLRVTEVADAPDPHAALAALLRDKPVWIFHGARDDAVPPEDDRLTYAALKAAGGDARYTEFPDAGHNAWDPAYDTPELWTWLFAQKLR